MTTPAAYLASFLRLFGQYRKWAATVADVIAQVTSVVALHGTAAHAVQLIAAVANSLAVLQLRNADDPKALAAEAAPAAK